MKSGAQSVSPSGQRLTAPATFTYRAPSKRNEAGRVLLRSVSRRGIGEAEAYFNTFVGYHLRLTLTYEGSIGILDGSSGGKGVDTFEGPLSQDTLEGTFDATSQGTATALLGDYSCTQTWAGAQKLSVTATAADDGGKPVLDLIFRPASAPRYTVRSASGDFCTFDDRINTDGEPILPFHDAVIIDQIGLRIPGPPSPYEPRLEHVPVGGQAEGIDVKAEWLVEWLKPEG